MSFLATVFAASSRLLEGVLVSATFWGLSSSIISLGSMLTSVETSESSIDCSTFSVLLMGRPSKEEDSSSSPLISFFLFLSIQTSHSGIKVKRASFHLVDIVQVFFSSRDPSYCWPR